MANEFKIKVGAITPNIQITDATASTTTGTGAAIITGGLGVGGRINATDFTGTIGANAQNTGSFTALTASGTTTLSGAITANTSTNNQSFTTAGTGTITISSATAGSINNMSIGATTRSTGAFTTLAANGATTLTAGVNSTNSTTGGTLTVTGGTAISQDLYVGGNLSVSGTFNPASINNAQIGNVTPSTGAFTTLTASGAVTFTAGTSSTTTGTGTLVVTGGVGVSQNLNVGGDLTLTGNLTVNGTTVTINSTTLTVDDKNIELGSVGTPSDTTADGGGITLKGATDKTITWVQSTGRWTFNTGIESSTGIVNTPISGSTGSFTTLTATGAITANTTTNSQSYTTTGAGSITITSATTGNINGMNIGGTTRGSGAFTTLTANGATTLTQSVTSTSTTTGTLVVTGGTGISENLNVGGIAGIGAPVRTGTTLVVAAQTTTIAPETGTNLHVSGANASFSRIVNDSYGTAVYPTFMGRAARGTAASPTAIQANDSLGRFGASGYGATGFASSTRVRIEMFASENWTDTAQGTYMEFYTTPNGTTTPVKQVDINQTGIVTFYDDTQTSAFTNGSVVISGGVGIAKDVRVNGDIFINNVKVQQIGQIITTAAGWNLP